MHYTVEFGTNTDLYHDSPGCPDEGLPGSMSLLPRVVGVVVKVWHVVRVLGKITQPISETASMKYVTKCVQKSST